MRNSKPLVATWQSATIAVAADNLVWASEKVKSNASTYSSAKTIGIALLVIAVLLGLAIAFLVSRSIKSAVDVVLDRLSSLRDKCATNLKAGIEALAKGDLTVPGEGGHGADREPVEG